MSCPPPPPPSGHTKCRCYGGGGGATLLDCPPLGSIAKGAALSVGLIDAHANRGYVALRWHDAVAVAPPHPCAMQAGLTPCSLCWLFSFASVFLRAASETLANTARSACEDTTCATPIWPRPSRQVFDSWLAARARGKGPHENGHRILRGSWHPLACRPFGRRQLPQEFLP